MGDHVFICYARENQGFVLQLAKNLKERHVPIWLDQWDIPFGADWDRSIDDAIYDCAKFFIVLSNQAEKAHHAGNMCSVCHQSYKNPPLVIT